MTVSREGHSRKLSADEFLELIKHAPLVSIDLILENEAGDILVGYRKNSPAKNTWFVPGGRIRKGETLNNAFTRITHEELGIAMQRTAAEFIGIFEHFYQDNFLEVPDVGTHYVVLAFRLAAPDELSWPAGQHSEFRWLSTAAAASDEAVHPYTRAYFSALG